MDQEKINKLKKIIEEAKHIVFLTGAGISKASGIPDIRGKDGLAKRKDNEKKYGACYEEIVSHTYFKFYTSKFFNYYFKEMVFDEAKPNITHKALAKLNNKSRVITQNIDGLHTKAGSKDVIELHGSVSKNHCVFCNHFFTLDETKKYRNEKGVPICPECGHIIKPDVVLFEEPLNEGDIDAAIREIYKADVLIVIGSSLVVNPAASLPFYFNGKYFIIINKDPTPLDSRADLVVNDDVEAFIDKVIN